MDTRIRKFAAVVFVVVSLVVCAAQTGSVQGQSPVVANSAVNGRIAFASYRGGSHGIYVMNADGTGVTRLTSGFGDLGPSWSPDGSKIAFSSGRDGGGDEIYVMNADGTGQTRLTYGLEKYAWAPSWSPDGSKIAFASTGLDGGWIYVMNADGSGATRLINWGSGFGDLGPSWSPDGSKIVFPSSDGGPGGYEIYVVNIDGSGVTNLTNNPALDCYPSWSPDGGKIAFASDRNGNDEIYIMNTDGSGVTNLTNNSAWDMDPSWSPDGSKIAFFSYRDGNSEIYTMNADGTEQTNQTNNPASDWFPSWGPGEVVIPTPTATSSPMPTQTPAPPATVGFLDLPVSYSNFAQAAQGNVGGKETGRVNSWVDHTTPTYNKNCNITVWSGRLFVGCPETRVDTCSTGISCYDGHNGVDLQHQKDVVNEPVFAAAAGTVVEVCRNYPCDRDANLGIYVMIDHGNGYATLYAHLKSVNNGIEVGTVIAAVQPIGVMGGTGGYPVHLHFGVYYDQNGDGKWTDGEVVDPYGWAGSGPDPWTPASVYLWKYSILSRTLAGNAGVSLTSQSGLVNANVPAGALTSEVTLELWDAPVANPSASLRSVGHSFWLRVLEWLTGSGLRASANVTSMSFSQPIALTVTYGIAETRHLDTTRLVVYRWDESGGSWLALPSTIDLGLRQVAAQTTEMGEFDLQAPLLCSADSTEPDDNYDTALTLSTDGVPVSRLFDIADDEDWFRFTATAGKTYELSTSGLGTGVDTILELYDLDGITLLVFDDNSGGGMASRLEWQAPLTGTYFLRVIPSSGSVTGCDATYHLSIAKKSQLGRTYLPIVLKN